MIEWSDVQRWGFELMAFYGLYRLDRIGASAERIIQELRALREAGNPNKFG